MLEHLHKGVAAGPVKRPERPKSAPVRRTSRGEWPDHEPPRVARGIAAGLIASAVFWVLIGLALWRWLG